MSIDRLLFILNYAKHNITILYEFGEPLPDENNILRIADMLHIRRQITIKLIQF